ncbi:phosphodiester glycosidase family protein [Paenibacillus lutimineralis]|uniref:Phosphodiester glycosidase family protein n=1 Tax=Paenibacillus lutimineralis TaxID=2707005 RepID=A0A3S9UTP3_9BACL|nr:phosphodiester glycosidase family protein [Paenibacillus lutimineralis]AZS13631.1 phosphodiester glycosidase family protein [Paenibacillus lutimineralis]
MDPVSSLPSRSSARQGGAGKKGHSTAARKPSKKRKRKKRGFFHTVGRMLMVLILLVAIGEVWLYLTPSGNKMLYLMADTLITTQHRHWAKYLIGQAELDRRVAAYQRQFDEMGEEKDTHTIKPQPGAAEAGDKEAEKPKPLIEIEEVSGTGYRGYVVTVNDPTKIRLGVPAKRGKGEKVSSMVERTGAIAGINGGGFADPNWKGNGFKPIGVVISQGKLYYNGLDSKKSSTQIVGIDKQGKMVAGKYSLDELKDMGIQEAVTFQPRIIVNGKGQIKSQKEGWGIAPRTAMGQREDGAILFVVIDGRQPGYSIGASLYDVQQIMLDHGAVIAANLDGGSSTVLVTKGGEIANKPSSEYGERYLPTAFLVFEHPEQVDIPNIWEGLRPQDIDPGKK